MVKPEKTHDPDLRPESAETELRNHPANHNKIVRLSRTVHDGAPPGTSIPISQQQSDGESRRFVHSRAPNRRPTGSAHCSSTVEKPGSRTPEKPSPHIRRPIGPVSVGVVFDLSQIHGQHLGFNIAGRTFSLRKNTSIRIRP